MRSTGVAPRTTHPLWRLAGSRLEYDLLGSGFDCGSIPGGRCGVVEDGGDGRADLKDKD